jgi:hypothetical protein
VASKATAFAKWFLVLGILLALSSGTVMGQGVGTGEIAGIITDPSGAVVPNVRVQPISVELSIQLCVDGSKSVSVEIIP